MDILINPLLLAAPIGALSGHTSATRDGREARPFRLRKDQSELGPPSAFTFAPGCSWPEKPTTLRW
jgi:hypothetical protein